MDCEYRGSSDIFIALSTNRAICFMSIRTESCLSVFYCLSENQPVQRKQSLFEIQERQVENCVNKLVEFLILFILSCNFKMSISLATSIEYLWNYEKWWQVGKVKCAAAVDKGSLPGCWVAVKGLITNMGYWLCTRVVDKGVFLLLVAGRFRLDTIIILYI